MARTTLLLVALAVVLAGVAEAQNCPPGKFWNVTSTGWAYCSLCPPDGVKTAYYCPGNTTSPLPCDNSTGVPTSNRKSCTGFRSCLPGYFLTSTNTECLPCPGNYTCAGGLAPAVPCSTNGFSFPKSTKCYYNNCPGGSYYAMATERCYRCPKGWTSPSRTWGNCTVLCRENKVCAPNLPKQELPCWHFSSRLTASPPGSGNPGDCQQGPDCSANITTCDCASNKLSISTPNRDFFRLSYRYPPPPLEPSRASCDCTMPARYSVGLAPMDLPLGGRYPRCMASGSNGKPCVVAEGLMRGSCCRTCREMNANAPLGSPLPCASWVHWIPPEGSADDACGSRTFPVSEEDCGRCIIYPEGTAPPKNRMEACAWEYTPYPNYLHVLAHWVSMGKGCPGGKNDPHFVGARGTRFGFNGAPGQSFCLVTDPRFQVNMRMHGFYDTNTYGASILRNGKAVRTWIKELAVLWVRPADSDVGEASPAVHSFRMVARDGKSMERGGGFVGALELDGQPVPRMRVGGAVSGEGGVKLTFLGYEKDGRGFFDVDAYALEIRGLLSAELRVRVAHPLLQTPRDAMAHINALFLDVEASAATHGILGQTFRPGAARDQRARKFSALARVLGHEVAADGASGEGFLDGAVEDYRTSCPLCADCKFSAFNGREAEE